MSRPYPPKLLARWKRRDNGFHINVWRTGPAHVACIVPAQEGVPETCAITFSGNAPATVEGWAAEWARKTVQAGIDRFNMGRHHVRLPS